MKSRFILGLLSVSALLHAATLQEKLRVVATKTRDIKENLKSGAYFRIQDQNMAYGKSCAGSCRLDCKKSSEV